MCCFFFFFKQKTAYEMRISDWSSDVCSSDLKVVARLAELGGKKLDKFDINNEAAAQAAVAKLQDLRYAVADVQIKPAKRHPAPPFTTSTLQQEAARKLGFSAQMTMQIAQRLYEGVTIGGETRSEEQTSELQSLMRISYAGFFLK